MDKFTKTTEIDISAMNEMEDETPKKSKVGKIIAMVICLIIAIFIWMLVMEVDTTIYEKEFKDISVEIIDDNNNYQLASTVNKLNIIVKGTNSDLVDIKESDIKIYLESSSFDDSKYESGKDEYWLPVVVEIINKGESITVDEYKIKVKVTQK
jgi:YbbR domain-containing protein